MKKVFVNGTFDIIHLGHLQLLNLPSVLVPLQYNI